MNKHRVTIYPDNKNTDIFTPEFNSLVATLFDEFKDRIYGAREERVSMLRAVQKGSLPKNLSINSNNSDNWNVSDMPDELRQPGIEISGPAAIAPMFINAVNPGPENIRAEGYLDDDEDAGGHTIDDTAQATRNRLNCVKRTLTFVNPVSKKQYAIKDGNLPFFMHRERGLHLDESQYRVDGIPVPATILGTAATLFYAGTAQHERGQGIYFYIPKTESPDETAIYRDLFESLQNKLPKIKNATIKGIILVESLPMVWAMEDSLRALGRYSAGLNAARWDLKASLLEYVMTDVKSVWPDRFGVSVSTTPFIANIFKRLVSVCHKHNAVAIGGMATQLPSKDAEVNTQAAQSITADKEWEAQQGFIRGWVAHIYHMKTAGEPFKKFKAMGKKAEPVGKEPDSYPVDIQVPQGNITLEGTRQNIRTIIEYLEGWLNGRGAKGIDRLLGKPGKHPTLMEDLATARISVAQVAQRTMHHVLAEDIEKTHTTQLVKEIINNEVHAILKITDPDNDTANRYHRSRKIALHWINNYLNLDFRSLGSYSRKELDAIASQPDAL